MKVDGMEGTCSKCREDGKCIDNFDVNTLNGTDWRR
jgi:hypothetical protein